VGLTVRSKIWFEVDGEFAIGEGGALLLKAVDDLGSLARAARHVGWSYRHAWGYVQHAEEVLDVRLLQTRGGKGMARGTALTPASRNLLAIFEQRRRSVDRLSSHVARPSAECANRQRRAFSRDGAGVACPREDQLKFD
jgi:molybdate transport system regulatory protein